MILRWFSEKGSLGKIGSSVLGLAWNLATFLVVPILVAEDLIKGAFRSKGANSI